MRKPLLTLALAALIVVPAYAQFPGRMGVISSTMLLSNKGVQDELKLNGKQKEALAKIAKKVDDARKDALESFDFAAIRTAMEASQKEIAKVQEGLSTTQAKRLKQIEIQTKARMTGLKIFADEEVQKALKLSEAQQGRLQDTAKDIEADAKEMLRDVAKGDREAMTAAMKKVGVMREKALAEYTKSLTPAQQNAWKDMTGAPFEVKFDFGGFGFKGKDKDKAKKDE